MIIFKKALPEDRIEMNWIIKSKNKRLIKFNLFGSFNKKSFEWTQEKKF